MNRSHEEIIKSILANLEMMEEVANRRAKHIASYAYYERGRGHALHEAITLIKTESGIK